MKKLFLVLAIMLLKTLCLYAQPIIQWQKPLGGIFGERANSISNTFDGGFILAGSTNSNDGDVQGNHGGVEDCWIIKLDSSSNIQWQKCLGGTGTDGFYSITQTTDGGYIMAGYTDSNDGNVSGHHGTNNFDVWVVKLDSSSNIQWQKCLGGSGDEGAASIQQTADGNYLIAGYSNSNDGDVIGHHGTNNYDAWIIKIDISGSIILQKCLGGSSDDVAANIQISSTGGFILGGGTSSNDGDVSGNHSGPIDVWIVKLDSAYSIEWQKCLGGTDSEGPAIIQQTIDGSYILTTATSSNDGDVSGNHGGINDCWLAKLNSIGNIQWQKCIGGSGDDGASSIQLIASSDFIIAGYSSSNDGDVSGQHGSNNYDAWVVKLDSSSNIQWQKCLGGTLGEGANSTVQTSNGDLVLAGFSESLDGDVTGVHGGEDYWVVKLDLANKIDEVRDFITDINIAPNPFSNVAMISFHLYNSELKKIEIYNSTGQFIKTLKSIDIGIGDNKIFWDGTSENGDRVLNGIYQIVFISKNSSVYKKIVLIN